MRKNRKFSEQTRRSLRHEPLEDRRMLAGLTVPALSSNPTASMKLYLDFDGHTEGWGSPFSGLFELDATTPPYSIDTDMSCFSATELQNIREIHQIVSEKFSPFDVDVTTIDPGSLDDGQAGKIVIGGDGNWYGGRGGGVAQLGGYYNWLENVAFVWDAPANVRYVGEAAAHEFGHMLGLHHQSIADASGTITTEYAPRLIMGSGGDGTHGGRWTIGTASGVDSFDGSVDNAGLQNDIGLLISEGLPLRADDHANVRTSATLMPVTSSGFAMNGVITPGDNPTNPDVDWFQFDPVLAGTGFEVRVEVDSLAPMLDPQLELYDASGSLVASANSTSYGETIEVAAATSPIYYAVVKPGPQVGSEFNVGSYRVVMERHEAADDTSANATFLSGVDGQFEDVFTYGRHVQTDFVGGTDDIDWYRFRTPSMSAGRRLFASLGNLSGNVDMHLLRDVDRNGSFDLGTSDVIASSTNTGTSGEFVSHTDDVFSIESYYLAVEHVSGAATGYTLTVDIDRTEPDSPFPLPRRGIDTHYDYVGSDDDDSFIAEHTWRNGIITRTLDIELEAYDQVAEIVMGYDSNGNRQLDTGEVTFTDTVGGGETEVYSNVRGRDLNRNLLLVEVRSFGTNRTNYRLQSTVDEMPVLDSSFLPEASHQLGGLAGSIHGGFLGDLILTEDDVDIVDLGSPSGGFMELIVTPPANGGANFELIADFNLNGVIDPDEVVSEGTQFFVQSNPQEPIPHYLLASFEPGVEEFVQYDLMYRDGLLLNQVGRTLANPIQLDESQGGSISGYVSISPIEELERPEAIHSIMVEEAGTLLLGLVNEQPLDPNDLPDAGLQVFRDFNEDGNLDRDERLAGFAGGDLAHNLQVNVTEGEYFVLVAASEPEAAEITEKYVDFKLTYEMDGVFDDQPVRVSWAELEPSDLVRGIFVGFDDNVEMTLSNDDLILRDSNGNEVEPSGQLYDPEEELLFVGLPMLPGGDYELLIRKESLADRFGNRLADDFVFEFEIKAGDFNGDEQLDCNDINALTAAIANGTNSPVFDLNGDGEVSLADIVDPQTGWLAIAGASSPNTGGNSFLTGDANLDGVVDISDFNIWNANKFSNSTEWCRGNFNADQAIDISDFNQWNANKFSSSAGNFAVLAPHVESIDEISNRESKQEPRVLASHLPNVELVIPVPYPTSARRVKPTVSNVRRASPVGHADIEFEHIDSLFAELAESPAVNSDSAGP